MTEYQNVRADEIELDTIETWKSIATAQSLRWVISAIILSGIAFFLYQSSFVGTALDCATVFFWGFTLDVGVNTVVEKATPIAGRLKGF